MDDQRKRSTARGIEVVTTTAAGSVAGGLGAAKLRDAYKDEHPEAFARAERRVATRLGEAPTKFLAHSKPGFKPLLIGSSTAVAATAASRYHQHHDRKVAHQMREHETALVKRDGDALTSLDNLDLTTRKLKARIVPSKVKVVRLANDTAATLKDKMQQDVQKAYDPQRSRRRRARALEVTAGAGAVGMGAMAAKEARDAHGRWAASVASQKKADDAFTFAQRRHRLLGESLDEHLKVRIPRKVDLKATAARRGDYWTDLGEGVHHLRGGYNSARRGDELMRGAERKGLVGAGLVAVAIGAHHHANKNRPRRTP